MEEAYPKERRFVKVSVKSYTQNLSAVISTTYDIFWDYATGPIYAKTISKNLYLWKRRLVMLFSIPFELYTPSTSSNS